MRSTAWSCSCSSARWPSPTSRRPTALRSVDHPGGADLHVRTYERQPPSGICDLRRGHVHVPRRGGRRLHRGGPRLSDLLIIPAALIFMYGRMSGNRRQGYAIYGVVMFMFLGAVAVAYIAEAHGSPAQHAAGLHTGVISGSGGGNLEGKE